MKTVLKKWDTLKEKATPNELINRDAYGMVPHRLFNLARVYPVPEDFLLTVLFLWDKTVGDDIDAPCGRCSLTEIPVRQRNARRWLAALTAVGFWECREKSGNGDKVGSLYEYKNPSADQWEQLFCAVSMSRLISGADDISPVRFGKMFARAAGRTVPTVAQAEPSAKAVAARRRAVIERIRNRK